MSPRKLEQTRSPSRPPLVEPVARPRTEGGLSGHAPALPPAVRPARRSRGLISKPSGPEVTAAFHPPPDDLADVVELLWVGRWDIPDGGEHQTELLGDPCMHVAFERCASFEEARLVGVWTKLWRRSLRGRGFVRAAKLRTGAATEWWSTPAVTFTNRITPLERLLGAEALPLRSAVLEPLADLDGLEALCSWLRGRRRSNCQNSDVQRSGDLQRSDLQRRDTAVEVHLVQGLLERVRSQPELLRAEDLARAAGLGLRALQQLFRTHVGASPKWLIRRYRLQEVATQLEHGQDVHLAQLAARLGYADQAHLTRDFKAATGRTPRQFTKLVRELP